MDGNVCTHTLRSEDKVNLVKHFYFCDEEIAKEAFLMWLSAHCQRPDVDTKAFLCDLSEGLRGGNGEGRVKRGRGWGDDGAAGAAEEEKAKDGEGKGRFHSHGITCLALHF